MHDLKKFLTDVFKIIDAIEKLKSSDWIAEDVKNTVVENGARPKIGRNLFSQKDFSLNQSK